MTLSPHLISLLSMLSSHSHPLPLIFFVLPVFPLLLSLSKFCFKSLSLKGRLLLLQTPRGLSSFFFMLLFFSLYLSFFFLLFLFDLLCP